MDGLKDEYRFLATLKPYTEVALGGGAITTFPDLDRLLNFLKNKKVFANITVHQKELLDNYERIQKYIDKDLVKGVGVSITGYDQAVWQFAKKNKNVVLHVIAGYSDVSRLLMNDGYANGGLKLLILGYKNWGRGAKLLRDNPNWCRSVKFKDVLSSSMEEWERRLPELFEAYKVVSFDNLALEQLHVKDHVDEATWNRFYMGGDGNFTVYVDLVEKKYASHSTAEKRFKLKEDISCMFKTIKGTVEDTLCLENQSIL